MKRRIWATAVLCLVAASAWAQSVAPKAAPAAKPAVAAASTQTEKPDTSEIPVPPASFAVKDVVVSAYTPVYVGVAEAKVTVPGRHASVGYVMRVDLRAPGIRFMVTPHSGAKETVSETSKEFAREQHLQVAINAGFFSPCCIEKPEDKDVRGLAIAEGQIVSPVSDDATYHDALVITKDNHASIHAVTASEDLSKFATAVTGSAVIVRAGKNSGRVNTLNKASYGNPRTVVGLSRDGRYLYLVAIDGRKPGYSFGTTNAESAVVLMALGAWTGLNLDGGGSTSMVMEDKLGRMVTVNRPSGGTDRLVASSIGLHARRLGNQRLGNQRPGNRPMGNRPLGNQPLAH